MEAGDPRPSLGQLEEIRPLNPDVEVRHAFLVGDPAEQILRRADEEGADLIVLGTHGRTGLARLLMGSVAETVLGGASCSVLVVKMPRGVPDAGRSEPVASGAGEESP